MKCIFALDLGTSTGWAVRRADGVIVSGAQSFAPRRFDGGGMRFVRFFLWLDDMWMLNPSLVVYEEVRRHLGVDAAHIYGGFLAQLTGFCEHRKIPYEGLACGAWKKALTGKGNAAKGQIMGRIEELGYQPKSQDEADALGVLLYAISSHDIQGAASDVRPQDQAHSVR